MRTPENERSKNEKSQRTGDSISPYKPPNLMKIEAFVKTDSR
jgi:hypothetical protein